MQRLIPLALFFSSLLACQSESSSRFPNIAEIYEGAATSEVRNPVIVIHGILGSRLERQRDGRVVWGAFTGDTIDPETPEGARAMALPLLGQSPGDDEILATGPVGTLPVNVLFATINVNVYAGILKTLGVGGFRDSVAPKDGDVKYGNHFTCHSFFYDWRQDCVANAQALAAFIRSKRQEIRETIPGYVQALKADGSRKALEEARGLEQMLEGGFRFDIVAHSMGGLLARWYLRYGDQGLADEGALPVLDWRGARDVDRLVLIGTPNMGSLSAFERLIDGFQPAFITPYYDPALVGGMPSLYQLLPRSRHGAVLDDRGRKLDHMDPELWIRNDWGMLAETSEEELAWIAQGITDPEARRELAESTLRARLEQAARFHAALDRRPIKPCPTQITLFAADVEETKVQTRAVRTADGRLRFDFSDCKTSFGDGTVTRSSALGSDPVATSSSAVLRSPVPWTSTFFIPDDHLGLTSNRVFSNNVLHILLEQATRP